MTLRIVITIFLLLLTGPSAGCDRKTPSQKAEGTSTSGGSSADAEPEGAFGGDHYGFIRWMQQDGAFVVMHRFDRDTNGDGEITARFGDHGEPLGDMPTPVTVDLASGEVEGWDEVVALGALGRWVVLQRGDELVALSAGKRWTIEGADLSADDDPCIPSRKASIEPGGTWMTYLLADPTRIVVKSLSSGEERTFPVEHLLSRADPTPLGWAVSREVVEDTNGNGELDVPRREGGCVCRWCGRFARSVGSGRIVGDEPTTFLIGPDGTRYEGFHSPLPISDTAVWELATSDLFMPDHSPRQLGPTARCSLVAVPIGLKKMVVRCGSEVHVWDPDTDTSITVEGRFDAVELFVPPRGDWIAVRIAGQDGGHYIGRLNVIDGRLERGPMATMIGPSHPSGWVLASDGANLVSYDVRTGQSSTIEQRVASLNALSAKAGDSWLVVDPSKGKLATLSERPTFIASNGCYIEPHPMNRPVKGPFRYLCP